MSDEQLYRIMPLQKKSVEYFVDVFERLPDGRFRGFDVTELYRWGQGFREVDDPVWRFEAEGRVNCRPEVGWGCELDDLISVTVNFGCWDQEGNTYEDGFTEEEKAQIEALCSGEQEDDEGRWGTAWIYDGDHGWEIEDDHVCIMGPVKIDIVDSDGVVIYENVAPYEQESNSTEWPFPTQT